MTNSEVVTQITGLIDSKLPEDLESRINILSDIIDYCNDCKYRVEEELDDLNADDEEIEDEDDDEVEG